MTTYVTDGRYCDGCESGEGCWGYVNETVHCEQYVRDMRELDGERQAEAAALRENDYGEASLDQEWSGA